MTPGASAASVGGAGGARGVGVQDKVFAWAAAAMAVETDVFDDGLVAGTVVRVGAQIGFHLDDVAVETDAANFGLFQVKAHLTLSADEDSALAGAVDQAVAQYLDGMLPVAAAMSRPIDSARDALVICTDPAAPATVRNHLASAVARTASQPAGTEFGSELTNPELEALTVLVDHARRSWLSRRKGQPTDEELRGFLRALRVKVLALDDGGPDRATAVARLSAVFTDAAQAEQAWNVIVREGHEASETRQWRNRTAVGASLARERLWLSPPSRYGADIATLQDLSALNRVTLAADAVLPIAGGVYIQRDVESQLLTNAGDQNLLIVGDAGSGKSSIAQDFAVRRAASQEVLVLRAADLVGPDRVMLSAPATTIFAAWAGPPAGPPPIPPPLPKPTITATPWSLVDDVLRQGAEIEAPVEQAARRLISETTAANNTADNRPETERQLPDAFQAAVDAFADAALPQELQDALLDAAATLAEDDRVSPDTPLGNEVLARLMAAAIDASAGSLHNAQMMSWSSGRRDTAVKGLAAMLRGPAWRNSPARPAIIDKLTAALSDENAVVRWHAAGVAHLLGADRSPEQRCQAISQLLVHEDMPATRAVLVQQLFYDVGADPDAVDAVVKQLVEHEPQAVAHPDRDLGHVIIELMVHLAVVRHTDFASETVDGWCRNSPAHRNEAKAVAGLLRDYLADADNRRDAFQLLSHAADAAAADWSALLQQTQPGGQPTDEQRARTTAAAEIAHEVAQSIYFASGAFEHGNNAPLADLDAFADSAFPVLARCATVSVAQVVHPCVETMVFLASPDEPRALDAIATAVPRDSQYAGDSLAGGVVIPYLRRLLTEQRHLVLYTDNGAAAFRRLLEIFAGAGNEDALALAYTFAEVFR
jgi:hypothetical protein